MAPLLDGGIQGHSCGRSSCSTCAPAQAARGVTGALPALDTQGWRGWKHRPNGLRKGVIALRGVAEIPAHGLLCRGGARGSTVNGVESGHEGKGLLVHSHGYRLLAGRQSETGRIYAVTAVTHERQPVLGDFPVGRLLVNALRAAHEQHRVCSLAWVVMLDHFHWLFELQGKCLSEVMCRVKSRSSLDINRARNSSGRLWQKGFYDRAIRKEEDLKTVARYIVANPVRAGLVQRVGDYPLWDATWL